MDKIMKVFWKVVKDSMPKKVSGNQFLIWTFKDVHQAVFYIEDRYGFLEVILEDLKEVEKLKNMMK